MKKVILSGVIAIFAITGVAFAQGATTSNPKGATISQENRDRVNSSSTSIDKVRSENKKVTTTAEQHRSDVAKFVQTLLASSTRLGGIGEQVRLIAQEQASSTEKTVTAIEEVEQRSKFKTFIIGTDYKNLGVIRSELVTMQNRLQRLTTEAERITSSTEKDALIKEIVSLGEERLKIETFVKNNENVFSLFGWVRKIFK